MVLYRKYRPQAFSEIVGQDHIREALLAQLEKGKISHAYLFTGPRGTGKTSTARIFAKAVNCKKSEVKFGEPCNECESCSEITSGNQLDLIEIDAASNRGIDEIRELREKIKLAPAGSRYKVYIIDEAHMLTTDAFNALLKTLEEPPPHAIFILATTEPQKIPATVSSRTQRFDFKVPTVAQISEKLNMITKKENWKIPEESLAEIAKMATGAFRDGEVLLEKLSSVDPKASLEKTREILGRKDTSDTIRFLVFLEEGLTKEALIWLNNFLKMGGNVRVLSETVLETLRRLILIKADALEAIEAITEEEKTSLHNLSTRLSKKRLLLLSDIFGKSIDMLREATIPQLPLELAIIEASLDNLEEKNEIAKPSEIKVKKNKEAEEETEETNELEGNGRKDEKVTTVEEMGDREAKKDTTIKSKAGSEGKILKKLQKDWAKVLKEATARNSSLVHFLKESKPVDIDEDLLTIEFGFKFHKEKAEEKKYRDVIEEALKKISGVSLRLKGVVGQRPETLIKEKGDVSKKKEETDPVELFGKLD